MSHVMSPVQRLCVCWEQLYINILALTHSQRYGMGRRETYGMDIIFFLIFCAVFSFPMCFLYLHLAFFHTLSTVSFNDFFYREMLFVSVVMGFYLHSVQALRCFAAAYLASSNWAIFEVSLFLSTFRGILGSIRRENILLGAFVRIVLVI